MRHSILYIILVIAFALPLTTSAQGQVQVNNLKARQAADRLLVTADYILDSLHLRSNATMVFTPVVEDQAGHTATAQSLVVNGRNRHYAYLRDGGNSNYPDAVELRRTNGTSQNYAYRTTIPYEAWMNDATVRVATDTCGCGNLLATAPGTPRDINPHYERLFTPAYCEAVAGEDPILSLHGRAYIDFVVNKTDIRPDYHNNAAELHKILQTIDTVRHNSKVDITAISIHGYASPEGPWDNNVRLASGRAKTLKDYVAAQYDFPASLWTVQSTPEDWDGLDSFLVASNLAHRDEILQIVRSDIEPDARDHKIRDEYPEQYAIILASCYPYLRHSDYEVQYRVRPMTDEEAAELLDTQPELLSLGKMYRIANLYPVGSDQYNHVLDVAASVYPSDPVANVNAAYAALRQNNLDRAERLLDRALQGGGLQAADQATDISAQLLNARGVLALLKGNTAEARQLFQQSGLPAAQQNLQLLAE